MKPTGKGPFFSEGLNADPFEFLEEDRAALRAVKLSKKLCDRPVTDDLIRAIERCVVWAYATAAQRNKTSQEVKAAHALAQAANALACRIETAPDRIICNTPRQGDKSLALRFTLPQALRDYAEHASRYAALEGANGTSIDRRKPRVQLAAGIAAAMRQHGIRPTGYAANASEEKQGAFARFLEITIRAREKRKPTPDQLAHLVKDAVAVLGRKSNRSSTETRPRSTA